jgi:hypothetical protein
MPPRSGPSRSGPSRQPPPQPPTAGFGYWEADSRGLPPQPPPEPPPEQQSPWEPTRQPPWEPWERWEAPPPPPPPSGSDDPYAYGAGGRGMSPYGYGPVVTRQEARSKTRLMVLVVSTLIGILLAAGGVYYMVKGELGGDAGASEKAPAGASSAGERPEGGKSGGARDGDDENGKQGKGGKEGEDGAGGGDFAGQWRSQGGAVLTIGKEARSGKSAGKQAVSYNRPGALSTCPGVGEARKSGAVFRLALKCANGKANSELGGDAVRSGDKLTVEWDGGSKDAFIRRGTQVRSDG